MDRLVAAKRTKLWVDTFYFEKSTANARIRLAKAATIKIPLNNHTFSIHIGSGTLIPNTDTSAPTSTDEPLTATNLGLTTINKRINIEISNGK
jgi:hypothetical protein